MTIITISDLYDQVNRLWELGLDPTFQFKSIPSENETKHNLIYINKNTVGPQNEVVASFEITYSLDGRVIDGNTGSVETIILTSAGYSSKFFFDQCALEVYKLMNELYQANGIASYTWSADVYANERIQPSASSVPIKQVKTDGVQSTSFCTDCKKKNCIGIDPIVAAACAAGCKDCQ